MKILMLIDSLDVGGAETHVETLALELVKMGCEVSIASNGGKIAQMLEGEGVKQLFCRRLPHLPMLLSDPMPHKWSRAAIRSRQKQIYIMKK